MRRRKEISALKKIHLRIRQNEKRKGGGIHFVSTDLSQFRRRWGRRRRKPLTCHSQGDALSVNLFNLHPSLHFTRRQHRVTSPIFTLHLRSDIVQTVFHGQDQTVFARLVCPSSSTQPSIFVFTRRGNKAKKKKTPFLDIFS